MKLRVENLGRIRAAELDLRPLTVLIGPNGTNKTWTTYGLFALLECLRLEAWRLPKDVHIDPVIDAAIERVVLDVKRQVEAAPKGAVFEHRIQRSMLLPGDAAAFTFWCAEGALAGAVGSPVNPDARIELVLLASEMGEVDEYVDLRIDKESQRLTVTWNPDGSRPFQQSTTFDDLGQRLRAFALACFVTARCLPAERNLLAQVYGAITQGGFSSALQGLPRALVDFANMMATGAYEDDGGSLEFMTWLETILGGQYVTDGHKRITGFQPAGSSDTINLTGTSSLIKSLTGLPVFLSLCEEGDMLLIDEPEMNAHPAAQAELIELLALLVDSGLRIVITTHSSYMLDHLGSLIEGARLPLAEQAEVAKILRLGDARAFLDPEKVAVYGFELREDAVEVRSLLNREDRDIDWSSFSNVSNALGETYGRILDEEREHHGDV